MNLYKYHSNPESLRNYKNHQDFVPEVIKTKIMTQHPLNKKQMDMIMYTPELALFYAIFRVKDRWPEGEDIIQTDLDISRAYESFLRELDPDYRNAEGYMFRQD